MKYVPIPDKYCLAEDIANLGGSFLTQTNANILRKYLNSTTSYVGSISAFTKNFDDIVTFSVYGSGNSSSSNYVHAITYLTNFNPFVRYYQELVATAFPYVVIMNIAKRDYGDRIKLGTLNIKLNNYSTSSELSIISATAQMDSRIFDFSISSLENYYYFYPFYNESNEVLFFESNTSLTSNNTFIGKLFPYNGFAVLTNSFTSIDLAMNFVNSITSVEYYTDLGITELNTYAIKEPFQMNGSRNPSIFKNALSTSSTAITEQGYSYGRDGLTGATGIFIDTVSAFNTYTTCIGFYNDLDELLMIAKLPQPIRLIPDLPYSFKVPLDIVIK